MIQITNPADCCGCTACASICAHEAITMKPAALGFLYPEAEKDKCVDCGLCDQVCAFHDHYDTSLNLPQPLAYAARHKDMAEVETSRSGAAFIAISDYILEQGGVVYGAGYADHFRVVHKRATTKEERNEFKGSKYVQSDMNTVFRQVKQDLRDGLKVLFSGTPCQTAGLHSYVGKRLREKLYLMDIICHGVPSPKLWEDYLEWQETKNHSIVTNVDFRNKVDFGWDDHRETLWFGKRKRSFNIYTHLFYLDVFLRDSCFSCKFCNLQRPSDTSFGDFWKLRESHPELNKDNKGYSLLLVNSEKGGLLLEACSKDLQLTACDIKDCMQRNLFAPTPTRIGFEQVRLCYIQDGFTALVAKYGNTGFWDSLRDKKIRLKRMLGLADWR
jgi:coenzyme F420-reducing hydrogenase beta subunit